MKETIKLLLQPLKQDSDEANSLLTQKFHRQLGILWHPQHGKNDQR
jgi:hypothetical protein